MLRRLRSWAKYGSIGSPKRAALAFDLYMQHVELRHKMRENFRAVQSVLLAPDPAGGDE